MAEVGQVGQQHSSAGGGKPCMPPQGRTCVRVTAHATELCMSSMCTPRGVFPAPTLQPLPGVRRTTGIQIVMRPSSPSHTPGERHDDERQRHDDVGRGVELERCGGRLVHRSANTHGDGHPDLWLGQVGRRAWEQLSGKQF